jgi:hypothetical protein
MVRHHKFQVRYKCKREEEDWFVKFSIWGKEKIWLQFPQNHYFQKDTNAKGRRRSMVELLLMYMMFIEDE